MGNGQCVGVLSAHRRHIFALRGSWQGQQQGHQKDQIHAHGGAGSVAGWVPHEPMPRELRGRKVADTE